MLLFTLAHFMHHVPGFIIQGVQTALMAQFHLSHEAVGFVSRSYNLAYGCGNLPAGWLGGRIAPRILIAIGVAGVAVFAFTAGFAPTYTYLLIAMVFVGVLGGGYHACASPVVSDTVAPEIRGRALAMHQNGGTAANLVVPVVAAAIASTLTWRWSYWIIAVPVIAIGIALYIVMTRRHLGDTPPPPARGLNGVAAPSRTNLRPLIGFIVVGTSVHVFVYSSIYYTQSLVVEKFVGTQLVGSLLFALSQFGGLFLGPLGGHVSDRIGPIPVMIGISLVAGPLLWALGLVSTWWLLPLALIAVGSCQYVAMPVAESYVIGASNARNRSTILGIYYFISRGAPGFLTPIIGSLIDNTGEGIGGFFTRFMGKWPVVGAMIESGGYARAFGITGTIVLCIAMVGGLAFFAGNRKTHAITG